MFKTYQILCLDKGANRWRFIAHGAGYSDPTEIEQMVSILKGKGCKVRLIPCPN